MSHASQLHDAYIAGFLDGDGSIYVRAKPNLTYKFGYQIAPYVAFFQSASCSDFPELCKSIGYGSLRLRKDGIYEFTLTKRADIVSFLEKTIPYLRLKRKQALLLLEILRDKDVVESEEQFRSVLNKINTFRELNYSKMRKNR